MNAEPVLTALAVLLIASGAVAAIFGATLTVVALSPNRYCHRCGALLEVTKHTEGYSPLTGNPATRTVRQCPNWRDH